MSNPTSSTSFGNPEIKVAQPPLSVDGKTICQQFLPNLQDHAATPAYHAYLCTKLNWTLADAKLVHWESLTHAIWSLLPNDQRRIVNCHYKPQNHTPTQAPSFALLVDENQMALP